MRRQIGKHRLLELLSFGKYSRAPALEQGEYPGTVPYDVKRDLRLSLVGEKRGEVADASVRQSTGTLALHLYDGRELLADRVRLATGYEHAATHPLLAQASEELGLPRWQENGFPRLDDRTLEWRGGTGNGRIYVAGHAAKMSLGPFGGNFRGAQFASELLATAIGLAPYR